MADQPIRWESYGSLRTYNAGDFIFQQGDPSDSIVVIQTGRVAILMDAQSAAPLILGYREAGRLVGEVSLIRNTTRTATVQAVELTEAWIISRDVFWQEFDTDPDFRHRVLLALITHLMVADESRLTAAAVERALSQAIDLRQQTTNFIVHDLRNPLTIIMGALSMLEDVPDIRDDHDLDEVVNNARLAAERMLTLVTGLLDAEKLKGDAPDLHLEPEDITSIVEEVVRRSQVMMQDKQLTLVADLPSDALPMVSVDRLRIDRVLTNLIDNAAKFTPHGGRITVGAARHNDSIQVSVNDSGPGIAPEDRGRVFSSFVQVQTGQERRQGFGLGLAYCLTAVQAHGGDIWVEDGQGGIGSRFVFSLPLGRPREGAVELPE